MHKVNITMWKLNSYWKSDRSKQNLTTVDFDAVIKSKLLYGIETVQLTEAMINELDAFHMKGLRIILGKKHSRE